MGQCGGIQGAPSALLVQVKKPLHVAAAYCHAQNAQLLGLEWSQNAQVGDLYPSGRSHSHLFSAPCSHPSLQSKVDSWGLDTRHQTQWCSSPLWAGASREPKELESLLGWIGNYTAYTAPARLWRAFASIPKHVSCFCVLQVLGMLTYIRWSRLLPDSFDYLQSMSSITTSSFRLATTP